MLDAGLKEYFRRLEITCYHPVRYIYAKYPGMRGTYRWYSPPWDVAGEHRFVRHLMAKGLRVSVWEPRSPWV